MTSIVNFLRVLYYKIKYRGKLKIGSFVTLSRNITFIIDEGSQIVIGDNSIVRDFVELRATKNTCLNIGSNCKLDRLVRIIATNGNDINIGRNTRIGIGSVLNGGEKIVIGENCLISGYVYLQTSMHNHKLNTEIINSGYTYGPITIHQDSWIGVHAVIFPSVTLGRRTVVGSNSVVNKNFTKNSIIGGIPAKELKHDV
ncbi:acetyltransferase [Thalassotalea loyana]|uniref:Acetyltransferase n=1 Tax=Thalassotalea loyana TaxID=280483 RepID=A0ABQ6HG97_9GAMM|nr:acyltransferase [Thalassotalea loyana]GLX86649.1 acetyltransferase [Thalassotalea loyana]